MDLFFVVQQLDSAALNSVQAMATPLLTALMLALTFFGNPVFWVGIAAALYWRSQENKGFFLMNLAVFASAAAGILKGIFLRPRPSPQEFNVLASDHYSSDSFPSGHATMAFAALSYAWKMIGKYWKAVFAAVVLLVAFSRIYLGVHFPSDVIAGIALGLVIGKLNLLARNRLFHRNFRLSKMQEEIGLVAVLIAGLFAIVFVKSLPMAGLFIGFYAGFFLFKELELSQSILMRKMLALKYAIGFALLAAIVLVGEEIIGIGICLSEMQRFALYFFGGLWISFIWPVLFEKLFMARKQ